MTFRASALVFFVTLGASAVAKADRASFVDALAEERWLEALEAYSGLAPGDRDDVLLHFGHAQALSAAGLDGAAERAFALAQEPRLRAFRQEPRAKSPLPLWGFGSAPSSSPSSFVPDIPRPLEVLRDVARKESHAQAGRRLRGESSDDYRMRGLALYYLENRTHSDEAAVLLEAAAVKKAGSLGPWLLPAAKAWMRARKEERAASAFERVQNTGNAAEAREAAHSLLKLQVTRADWASVSSMVSKLAPGSGLDADDLLRLKGIAAAVSEDGPSLGSFRAFRALHEPRSSSLFAGRLALLEALGLQRRGRATEAVAIWERLETEGRPIVAFFAREHLKRVDGVSAATCHVAPRLVDRILHALPRASDLASGPWLHALAGAGLVHEVRQELRSIGFLDAGPKAPFTKEGWAELQLLAARFDRGLGAAPGHGPAVHGPAFWPELVHLEGSLGIPRGLLASLMRQESGYHADARSPAGALGLMQLMPGTAVRYLPSTGDAPLAARLRDPLVNLHAGAAHLAMLLVRTRGEISLAVGAYNAGLEPVERWRTALRGGPPELLLEAAAFGETRHYMWAVLDDWIDVRRCLGLPLEDPI